jgi:MoxR-like ATPase
VALAQGGKLTEERSEALPSVCAQLGIGSPAELAGRLAEADYIASESLATSIYLALALRRPLLLEGEAGVGKTEVAKTLARLLGSPLIRLQCYEGIDASQALYEWNYSGQLLHLRTVEMVRQSHGEQLDASIEDELYSDRFLVRRPLLRALDPIGSGDTLPSVDGRLLPAVLLIDELDRADDEFEAFLLEALSDYAATIPELGTIVSQVPPVVIITSNRTRDLHDALKRRCLYHWVDHPDFETEVRIIMTRVPGATELLAKEVAVLSEQLRSMGLFKPPGVAESIDWVRSLQALGAADMTEELFSQSLASVVKYKEDAEKAKSQDVSELIRLAVARAR